MYTKTTILINTFVVCINCNVNNAMYAYHNSLIRTTGCIKLSKSTINM